MGFSDTTAAYFSRTLIGCELALGILLLQSHYYKRLVLPMSFLILFIFSVHLSYGLIVDGNDGNCGTHKTDIKQKYARINSIHENLMLKAKISVLSNLLCNI